MNRNRRNFPMKSQNRAVKLKIDYVIVDLHDNMHV